MTPTPVGMRCPECSKQRTKVRSGPAAYSTTPTLTYVIIGICVAVQLGQSLSPGQNDIFVQGALFGPAVADGDLWRLVTSGFLHAGLIHLLFNMYALYILGSLLEPAIGRVRFALMYFVSLLCGSFGALLLTPDKPTVGASGAVFGLMAGALVIMRKRGIDLMASGLPFWLGLNLVLTFTLSGLSVGGHLGGIVGGVLAAVVMFELPERLRLPRIGAEVLAGALGAAAVVGSVMVVG
jgi:membrane associated rhomboid family serine protease